MPYADFWNNYYHSKTLKAVKAFVVDCDGVTSVTLNKIIRYLWKKLPAEPTHIVNSGKGVHFVYMLNVPFVVKGYRWTVRRLNETIQDAFAEDLEVDKHSVVHPYRFPEFLTKIETKATVFQVRAPYTIEELLYKFAIPLRAPSHVNGNSHREEKREMDKFYRIEKGHFLNGY